MKGSARNSGQAELHRTDYGTRSRATRRGVHITVSDSDSEDEDPEPPVQQPTEESKAVEGRQRSDLIANNYLSRLPTYCAARVRLLLHRGERASVAKMLLTLEISFIVRSRSYPTSYVGCLWCLNCSGNLPKPLWTSPLEWPHSADWGHTLRHVAVVASQLVAGLDYETVGHPPHP
ncbi:hypothetical protein NDU88_003564 [Pleurodeles waltl]|uniref:Uncharacterized protein n=1 Tax=Pleurodeles waltl TaxID=8319 RepID=A0AAV7Q9B0_PLEWA|nr:hypothetical protein NDU88_003564 [Pleurodeles waltl]